MRTHSYALKQGITRTDKFKEKKLACFAVNVGTKCGHDCLYCSTGAMLRMHPSFKAIGEDPFGHGYSILDPEVCERVARSAKTVRKRGLVQLCTIVDAWSPEAHHLELGRRCLEAILAEPGWTVRILTKNAAVRDDFDLIEHYRDRVLVGLSITATPDKESIVRVIEPNASPVSERLEAVSEAKSRGLRTYAMFCPLLPGIADEPEQIESLIETAVGWGVEEVFVEAVNGRARGLIDCEEVLAKHGYLAEAQGVNSIRSRANWSLYVVNLINRVQQSTRRLFDIARLRFLLYPNRLLPEHADRIRRDDEGVVWL